MTKTYVIRLTEGQWDNLLSVLHEIRDAAPRNSDIGAWAEGLADMLNQEVELPAQQAAERAEALGDETDF